MFAIVVLFVRLAHAALDECGLYYADETVTCSDEGLCLARSTPCEDAARAVANWLGSVPLPERQEGQLRVPGILANPVWPPPSIRKDLRLAQRLYLPTEEMTTTINAVLNSVKAMADELTFWAPRVLYVPARIEDAMQMFHSAMWAIGKFPGRPVEVRCYVASVLNSSPIIEDFFTQVSDLWYVISKMPDIRTNGYLRALIPFLHVYSAISARFPLPDTYSPGFGPSDLPLLLTIAQFDPLHFPLQEFNSQKVHYIWAFRVIDVFDSRWGDYASERFLLPMSPSLEHRGLKHMMVSLGCQYPVELVPCTVAINSRINEYLELEESESNNPGISFSEYVANILFVFEHLTDTDPDAPFREHLSSIMRSLVHSAEAFQFSQFASRRATAILYKHFRESTSLSERILSAFNLPPGRSTFHPGSRLGDHFLFNRYSDPQQVVDCVLSKGGYALYATLVGSIDEKRTVVFFDLIVRPSLEEGSTTRLKSSVTPAWCRAIGRMLAYALWRQDVEEVAQFVTTNVDAATHTENKTYMDVLFLGSANVRRGFYDWFSFEALENYIGIGELGAALREYVAIPIHNIN